MIYTRPIRTSKELLEEIEKIKREYGVSNALASKILVNEYRELKQQAPKKKNPWNMGVGR